MPIRKSTPEEVEAFYGQGLILFGPGRRGAAPVAPEKAKPGTLSAEEEEIASAMIARVREELLRRKAQKDGEED